MGTVYVLLAGYLALAAVTALSLCSVTSLSALTDVSMRHFHPSLQVNVGSTVSWLSAQQHLGSVRHLPLPLLNVHRRPALFKDEINQFNPMFEQ